MESLFSDLRYGWRMLRKSPGFAAVAILTMALGVGANTAIFSVINAVLLQPLPYPHRERLVMVWELNYTRDRKANAVGPANYLRWREQNHVFEDIGAGVSYALNLTGNGDPERVPGAIVTPSLFSTLGIKAALGRTFLPEEDLPGKDNVVVLSDGLWKRRFGADPHIVGKSVSVNSQAMQVIGVLPPRTSFLWDADLWVPLTNRPQLRNWEGRYLSCVGRLKPGVSLGAAQADMDVLAAHLRTELAEFDAGWGINLVPLREQLVGGLRRALLVLLGAVAFVLLIACANVANLLLARASAREKEIGVRNALGITRGRLIRQLLTESVLLSVLGGAAGLLLAWWAINWLPAIMPSAVPGHVRIALDPMVLIFTAALSLVTGILFGLSPALRVSTANPYEILKAGTRAASSPGRHRLRNVLLVAEAATAVVLLVGAGLLIRSFGRLLSVPTGFEPRHVLTFQVSLPGTKYRKDQQAVQFFQQALERMQSLPGVTAAGAISYLPLDGPGAATIFLLDDRPRPQTGEEPVAEVRAVSSDYFRAMGIPFFRGRNFARSDSAHDAMKEIVINQTMVRTFWPDQDPIGKTISMDWENTLHGVVVGVVADVKMENLEGDTRPGIYWDLPQFPYSAMTIVVRTSGDPRALVTPIRAQIATLDPEQPIAKIRTMDEVVSASVKQPRFTMLLLAFFSGLALLLAVIGIYGVTSYSVTQRTHELGIRVALGAGSRDIARMIVTDALRLTAAGIGVGLLLALVVGRTLHSLLFEIGTADPLTFVAVAAISTAVALIACYIPARRAAKVDPLIALRYE